MKSRLRSRRTQAAAHVMGTGGGPALPVVSDPILARVEAIVPYVTTEVLYMSTDGIDC